MYAFHFPTRAALPAGNCAAPHVRQSGTFRTAGSREFSDEWGWCSKNRTALCRAHRSYVVNQTPCVHGGLNMVTTTRHAHHRLSKRAPKILRSWHITTITKSNLVGNKQSESDQQHRLITKPSNLTNAQGTSRRCGGRLARRQKPSRPPCGPKAAENEHVW